jgi:methyl-accepting chemotaxis protein
MESRTRILVKPGFQKKMMIIMILVVVIAVNLVGGLVFGFITTTLEDELLQSAAGSIDPSHTAVVKDHLFEYIFPKVLIAEGLTILVLAFLSLRLTHHIAGPVYRLEQSMHAMAQGQLGLRTAFRERDEFVELATALNELGDSYCARLRAIEDDLGKLNQTELSPEQKNVLVQLREKVNLQNTEEDG